MIADAKIKDSLVDRRRSIGHVLAEIYCVSDRLKGTSQTVFPEENLHLPSPHVNGGHSSVSKRM